MDQNVGSFMAPVAQGAGSAIQDAIARRQQGQGGATNASVSPASNSVIPSQSPPMPGGQSMAPQRGIGQPIPEYELIMIEKALMERLKSISKKEEFQAGVR